MSKVAEQVLADFYARLEKSGDVDNTMVQGLKKLFESGKKLKVDELVVVFQQEEEGKSP